MPVPSEGWALVVTGDRLDLDDLRDQLRPPFDPWVEEYDGSEGNVLLLRSKHWSSLAKPRDVMDDARRLLEQINASMLLGYGDSKPVSLGSIFKFRADGSLEPILIAGSMHITLSGFRVRGRAVVGDGVSKEPSPSPLQRRIELAAQNDRIADALAFISRADNWFDLYKAMESLEALLPGKDREAKRLYSGWSDARRTANHARHSPAKWEPLPDVPPTFEQAKALVIRTAAELTS